METLLHACLGILGLAVGLAMVRLVRGPTMVDRMLAFDLVAVCGVGMIAIVSLLRRTNEHLELVIVYSLVGFVGTVAMTRYLQRSHGDRVAGRRPGNGGGHA